MRMHLSIPLETSRSKRVIYWGGLELEGWDDLINLLEEAWVQTLLAYRILF